MTENNWIQSIEFSIIFFSLTLEGERTHRSSLPSYCSLSVGLPGNGGRRWNSVAKEEVREDIQTDSYRCSEWCHPSCQGRYRQSIRRYSTIDTTNNQTLRIPFKMQVKYRDDPNGCLIIIHYVDVYMHC